MLGLFFRRRIQPAFTPATPSNLQLWLDVSQTSSLQKTGAVQFTLSNTEWLAIANNTGMQFGNQDWTVAFWCNFDTTSGNRTLFCKEVNSSNREVLLLATSTAYLLRIYDGTNTQLCSLQCNNTNTTGTWFFVCAQYQSSTNKAFLSVNAGSQVNATLTGTPGTTTGDFRIGYSPGANAYMDGRVANFGYWHRLLSSSDITSLYNSGSGYVYSTLPSGITNNMVSWWNLSETSGTRHDHFGTNDLTENFNAIISPTVLNGGFETAGTGGADVFGTWNEITAGTSTINSDTTNKHSGTAGCRFDIDASNSNAQITQPLLLVVNKKYTYSYWAKASNTSSALKITGLGSTQAAVSLTTSFVNYTGTAAATSTTFDITRQTGTSQSIYVDDITLTAAEVQGGIGLASSSPSLSGDGTNTWNDLSGNHVNVTQSTGNARPAYQPVSQNGRGGLLFDGINDMLAVSSGITPLQVAAKTMFLVVKPSVTAPGETKGIFGTPTGNFYVGQANAGGVIISWIDGSAVQHQMIGGNATSFDTSRTHLITNIYTMDNSGNPTIVIWLDGIQVNVTVRADGYSSSYGTSFSVGGLNSVYFTGLIYEVIFYNRSLGDYERQKVEGYLKKKWGTP